MTPHAAQTALNGICPYFTMFPLKFPLGVLQHAKSPELVLDPFCGRGTTNFAARTLGLNSLGVDSSPTAEAITRAKLVQVKVSDIRAEAQKILAGEDAVDIPVGEFWEWAYHPEVIVELCRFRTAFLKNCSTAARIALRGIILGALHGPRQKTLQSYFSNQSPRTYAPKPSYAARYWRERNWAPSRVDALEIIERRANRYYRSLPKVEGRVRLGDSREPDTLVSAAGRRRFAWVITSPPYYGMRTYIPDQWLRHWFVGGSDRVDYSCPQQLAHSSPDAFVSDLRRVWDNAAKVCAPEARMVFRFGSIANRRADPLELAKSSLEGSAWRLTKIESAGSALEGRRQADAFLRKRSRPLVEYDLWARLA